MNQASTPAAEIWLVDDEPEIRSILCDYLTHAGYVCREFEHGEAMLAALAEGAQAAEPALILLDIMMPGMDGLEVCRTLRERSKVPVLFLTARHDEFDRILGLKLGADDYLVKPISPREVVARVEAMLRRIQWQGKEQEKVSSPLELNHNALEVRIDGVLLTLTVVEFRLLATLNEKPGRVFKRNELINAAYDDHRIVSDRTVDSHIKNLRAKMAEAAPKRELIQSVYGMGYKLLISTDTP